jgi:hypothetical protein
MCIQEQADFYKIQTKWIYIKTIFRTAIWLYQINALLNTCSIWTEQKCCSKYLCRHFERLMSVCREGVLATLKGIHTCTSCVQSQPKQIMLKCLMHCYKCPQNKHKFTLARFVLCFCGGGNISSNINTVVNHPPEKVGEREWERC